MLVGERMSKPAITIQQDMRIQDALNLMQENNIRRLPVTDTNQKLIGMVSERDLMHATPSDATSLSIWELNYLLSKITVKDLMTKDIITVTEDIPLEEAARIMTDMKISGLPVIDNKNKVVGIITETDIFKVFVELLGARERGVRVTMLVPDRPGKLVDLTQAIFNKGGNIITLSTFLGPDLESRVITIKLTNIAQKDLEEAVKPHIEKIIDIREI